MFRRLEALHMSIDEPAHKRDQHRTDQQVELMQSAAHVMPMLAQFVTGVAKRSAPGKRSIVTMLRKGKRECITR